MQTDEEMENIQKFGSIPNFENLTFSVSEKEQPRILIATPAYNGDVTSKYTECLIMTCNLLGMNRIEFQVKFLNNQIVTRARNMLAHIFMTGNFTHMLFIDADISWNPHDVINLLSHDEECVIGVYPNKAYHFDSSKKNISLTPSSKILFPIETKGEYLKRIKHAATGFMLLKKAALKRIEKDIDQFYLPNNGQHATSREDMSLLYNYFNCQVVDNDYLTEDYYFSHLFNKNGGKIYADTRINLLHIGNHHYGSLGR
tara:strand:- start:1184 stop:1954 length:771 start_codon:yes stop_codon:yes gene_type:complete